MKIKWWRYVEYDPNFHSRTNRLIIPFDQIPAGTSSHARICLTGKGLKRVNGRGIGDHYVSIKILTPKRLTSEQKKLAKVKIQNNAKLNIKNGTISIRSL